MLKYLLSAGHSLIGFALRSVVVKMVLYFGLFFIASEFVQLATGCQCVTGLISLASFGTALNSIGSGAWFFLNIFKFTIGLQMFLCALAVRFLIRRIPFFN